MARKKETEPSPEEVIARYDDEIRRLKEKKKEAVAQAVMNKYKKLDRLIEVMEQYYGGISKESVDYVINLIRNNKDGDSVMELFKAAEE